MLIHRHKTGAKSPAKVEKPIEKKVEKPVEKVEKPDVTKDEVEKMPYFGVKSLAEKIGIDTTDKKANELKVEVIKKLEL